MGRTYNGRFILPEEPKVSSGWLVAGLLMIPTWPSFFTLVASVCCFVKYGKQVSERNLFRRFQRYCTVIGMRGRVPLRQLKKANEVGTGIKQIREDLQKMIVHGYFGPGAYIDLDRDELVLPDVAGAEQRKEEKWGNAWDQCDRDYDAHGLDAFMEVLNVLRGGKLFQDKVRAEDYAYRPGNAAQAQKPAPKREENRPKSEPQRPEQPEPEKPKRPVVPPKRTYAEELERTLNELYQLNAKIEDEGVSQRIDRIGTLTAGIFRVVIEKPEREQDVRKFMNYYLPTTLKLLRSYDLMEEQEYQSESIQESRRKIEEVLDTLIQAYEKQLDRLFKDDALDIATDIDVLETMMAGDGLM